MRVVIITQEEPFYLHDSLEYLFNLIPNHSKVVACVLFETSPFGKKESFLKKAIKTLKIFGLKFFTYYSIKFIVNRIFLRKSINLLLKKNNIPIIKLKSSINSKISLSKINSYKPDLLVSILGNQIFKKELINLAPKGCINLHSALLPKYRGLMPTFWVLRNNERKTGVSVFFVDEGIDSGLIIVQKEIVVGNKTHKQLIQKTKRMGMEAIAESIDKINKGKLKLIPNDVNQMSYYSFPTRSDVLFFLRNKKKFF